MVVDRTQRDEELVRQFLRNYATSERAVSRPTRHHMVEIGEALRKAAGEPNLQELSKLAGCECSHHLGAKAGWTRPARTALAHYAIERGGNNARLRLGVRMNASNPPWIVCWVVTLDDEQCVLDCIVTHEAKFDPGALLRLLLPLAGPLYRGKPVTVVEAQRLFVPQVHPLRTAPGMRLQLEYALRVERHDRSPRPRNDLLSSHASAQRPGLSQTVARTLSYSRNAAVITYDPDLPYHSEVLTTASDNAIVLARPMPDHELSNAHRLARAHQLASHAAALARGKHMGRTKTHSVIRSREAPLPLENAILLLAVLDAAGAGS
ncbi:MAG: hypothetical protein QOK36_2548 [Gaiellales bacterium]|jgi:hypothetical protein|nr:hypothetical protein [Gaiellales bacterium]